MLSLLLLAASNAQRGRRVEETIAKPTVAMATYFFSSLRKLKLPLSLSARVRTYISGAFAAEAEEQEAVGGDA
eukprot:641854-Alexandrium_andersonii.AAC.1